MVALQVVEQCGGAATSPVHAKVLEFGEAGHAKAH